MSVIRIDENDVIGRRYKILRHIGEGGMQHVYASHDMTMGRVVALKTPKNISAEKRFQRSAILSAKITHPNVAKTLDYFVENDHQYFVEEFIDGLDLQSAILERLKFVDPFLVAKIIHNLSKGLAASHHVGVVHRDMKPSNIMVEGGVNVSAIKITDFGIAKMAAKELAEAAEDLAKSITRNSTLVGALPYMAPEMIEAPKNVGAPADIWSVGAILYELMTGTRPFGSGLSAVPNILNARLPKQPKIITVNPQFAPLATELLGIVTACLQRLPEDRPSADDLVQQCNNLCYYDAERKTGYVNNLRYQHGFITDPQGNNYFFHNQCVFGDLPAIRDNVCFSSFHGGGSDRAYPVVLMKDEE